MSKKTRITNANILAEQRYLSKKFINEIDIYPTLDPLPNPWVKSPIEPIKSTYNVLTDDDKAEISSALWDKIKSNEELK